jgi:hypothetical protein
MKTFSASILLALVGSVALAQQEPIGASMRFEAWDGSAWSRSVTVNPGARIEWRIVMDYTGARTDLTAMGEVLYQPIMSNADNTGTLDINTDRFGDFRLGGFPVPAPGGGTLTEAEGNDPNAIADGYGRVRFGSGTAINSSNQNIMTTFRHSNGSNNAPPGEWMRIAGSFVSQWPTYPLTSPPGATLYNEITRGITSSQISRALTNPQSNHHRGINNLVIFRMATLLANDNLDARTMTISSSVAFLRRAGGPTSTDDTRYMTWQTGDADNGSVRVGVEFQELTINVVPAPGAAGVLLVAVSLMPIRRRC